jgi:hypothetical protein
MLKPNIIISIFCILCIAIFNNCGDKMLLPSVQSSVESFGANDTSYIHLNPDWDAATMGYTSVNPMTPVDIAIGDDDYIFIADSANNQIITLYKSGAIASTQNLNTITSIPGSGPLGIDINSKLNLLIVNGTNVIYVWNQYFNNIGIDSVIVDINLADTSYIFSGDPNLIDSVLGIHPFYIDENENSSFQGVAFGPSSENTVFVTDKGNNRILKLQLSITSGVLLENGFLFPSFTGIYDTVIASYGSGAGTVDNPRGITTDNDGNVYFTQLGGNFFVQKLEEQGDQYVSSYTLYEDPIMDLNRFISPFDIALGESDAIFVVDTGDSGRVSKFHNKGVLSGRISDLGRKGLIEARFNQPLGIAVSSEEIVYIANTGKNTIERYQYSVSERGLPDDEN